MARALVTAGSDSDPGTRERALSRAKKWESTAQAMLSGALHVGSRTPSAGVPAWATLEVLTGGFATGALLAGGPVREHERALAARIGAAVAEDDRLALNLYFLTDAGIAELQDRLKAGTFEVDVPEEGALLVVAWLLGRGEVGRAQDILAHIETLLPRLRFYPRFVDQPRLWGSRAQVQDVKATIESLERIKPNASILAQQETICVWLPLYDEAIALLLETVSGEAPRVMSGGDRQRSDNAAAKLALTGGWPCQHYPDGWSQRARSWLARVEAARSSSKHSTRAVHRKSSLAQLLPLIAKCASEPKSLSGLEVGKIRLVLARYVAKHGVPKDTRCRDQRERQKRQASTPLFSSIARVVSARLRPLPADDGVDSTDQILSPLTSAEADSCGVEGGALLPEAIRRKAERCLNESVEVLVERGLITSGDALAKVLPQVTSGVRSVGISDPQLKQVYAAIYRAFRSRRSLLLLDLQSQVKIHELPWVSAIEAFRDSSPSSKHISRQVLDELTRLALISFPQAILPNKLLQELRALSKGADVSIPLVDELAADIFMGRFSPKFTAAAKVAGILMRGTLYARYYGVDFDRIASLPDETEQKRTLWGFGPKKETSNAFAELCMGRAGVVNVMGDPAVNGMIIEQQQIITTQNLAALVSALDLRASLEPHLTRMATECFTWVCRGLRLPARDWHSQLIVLKNSAYAWRQMIFFLSLARPQEVEPFIRSAHAHLAEQPVAFRDRFTPVLEGLRAAVNGDRPDSAGRVFLGWSKERHWLIDPQAFPKRPSSS